MKINFDMLVNIFSIAGSFTAIFLNGISGPLVYQRFLSPQVGRFGAFALAGSMFDMAASLLHFFFEIFMLMSSRKLEQLPEIRNVVVYAWASLSAVNLGLGTVSAHEFACAQSQTAQKRPLFVLLITVTAALLCAAEGFCLATIGLHHETSTSALPLFRLEDEALCITILAVMAKLLFIFCKFISEWKPKERATTGNSGTCLEVSTEKTIWRIIVLQASTLFICLLVAWIFYTLKSFPHCVRVIALKSLLNPCILLYHSSPKSQAETSANYSTRSVAFRQSAPSRIHAIEHSPSATASNDESMLEARPPPPPYSSVA